MKEAMKEAYLASEPIAMEKEEIIPESTAFMTEEERALHDDIYIKLGEDNIELILKNNKLETFMKPFNVIKSSLVYRLRGGGRGRGGMMGAGGGGDDDRKSGDDIKKLLKKMEALEITQKENQGSITGLDAENKKLKIENKVLQTRVDKIAEEFICPITCLPIAIPVILSTGIVYEADAIQAWFAMGNNTCPVTKRVVEKIGGRRGQRVIPSPLMRNIVRMVSDEEDNQAEEGKGAEEQQESKAAPLPPVPPGDIAPEARV